MRYNYDSSGKKLTCALQFMHYHDPYEILQDIFDFLLCLLFLSILADTDDGVITLH